MLELLVCLDAYCILNMVLEHDSSWLLSCCDCACAILLDRFTAMIVFVRFFLIAWLRWLCLCDPSSWLIHCYCDSVFFFLFLVSIFVHVFVTDLFHCNRPWKETLMINPLSVVHVMIHEISEPNTTVILNFFKIPITLAWHWLPLFNR